MSNLFHSTPMPYDTTASDGDVYTVQAILPDGMLLANIVGRECGRISGDWRLNRPPWAFTIASLTGSSSIPSGYYGISLPINTRRRGRSWQTRGVCRRLDATRVSVPLMGRSLQPAPSVDGGYNGAVTPCS